MGRRVEGDGMPKDAAVEEFAALVRALKARDGRSYEALGRLTERQRVHPPPLLLGRDRPGGVRRGRPPRPAVRRGRGGTAGPGGGLDGGGPRPPPSGLACAHACAGRAGTGPRPRPGPERAGPERAGPDRAGPVRRGSVRAGGPRARPRRGAPVALLAAAVALVVLALAAALLGHPTRTASAPDPAPASTAPGRTAAPLPFTWSIDSQLWEGGCGHTYLVDRAPRAVAPPPVAADSGAWAGTHGAVHGGEALVRITVQGRSPSDAVVLHALHVRVVDRATPLPWNAYRMDNGCGGAVTPRHFAVDLDRPRPLARPVDGLDASGAEVRKIPAVSFPYKVTSFDPEELLVSARAAGCDCRWYLELEWSAGGRTGTVLITDGGKPFRTSGTRERPAVRARLCRRALDHRPGLWTDRVIDEQPRRT